MSIQRSSLKRSAPGECDVYPPSKAGRFSPLPSPSCKRLRVSRRADPRASGISPRKFGTDSNSNLQDPQPINSPTASAPANSFVQRVQQGSGSRSCASAAYAGIERTATADSRRGGNESSSGHACGIQNSPVSEANLSPGATDRKGKEKVEEIPELDLADLIPTADTASSSAPPYIRLQTLLENMARTREAFEKSSPHIPVTLASIIEMILPWESELQRGIHEMEKAETQRVIQLSEDIDRQDQHEAKHKSELAAKEQRHKIKLAVQEQRHKKNVASSKLLWEGKLKQMETKLKTHYNEREKQHETKIAQMNNALKKQEENFDKECRKVREMKEQYETKFAKLQTLKEQLAPEHAKALQTPPCRKRKLDGSEMCGIERGPSSKKSRVGGGM